MDRGGGKIVLECERKKILYCKYSKAEVLTPQGLASSPSPPTPSMSRRLPSCPHIELTLRICGMASEMSRTGLMLPDIIHCSLLFHTFLCFLLRHVSCTELARNPPLHAFQTPALSASPLPPPPFSTYPHPYPHFLFSRLHTGRVMTYDLLQRVIRATLLRPSDTPHLPRPLPARQAPSL